MEASERKKFSISSMQKSMTGEKRKFLSPLVREEQGLSLLLSGSWLSASTCTRLAFGLPKGKKDEGGTWEAGLEATLSFSFSIPLFDN